MGIHDILSYFRIIYKWKWLILLLFVATVGTMVAVAYFSKTQYEATVTLQVSAPPPQEVPLYSQFGRGALRDEIEQTQASFKDFLIEGSVPWQVLKALPDIHISGEDLKERITVDIPDNSQLMYIRVYALDSETAALLANTLAEIGLQAYGELLAQPTMVTRKFIEQELATARQELELAEQSLVQFQVDNKIGTLNSTIAGQQQLIQSLQTQSDLARAEGDTAKAAALQKIILEREAELQNMLGLSATYSDLTSRVDQARTTYNFLLDRKTEAQIKESQILKVGAIQIITPARPPQTPVATLSPTVIALGAVVSLAVGVLLGFVLEYMERSKTVAVLPKPERPEDLITIPTGSAK